MSNENKIRVLYVQPGKYPEERVIEHTLAAMQALVGGDIEAVYPWEDTSSIWLMTGICWRCSARTRSRLQRRPRIQHQVRNRIRAKIKIR